MATKYGHPGRTITIFLLVILAMFGGMAAMHSWTPKLGLDLRGGTTIILTAKNTEGGRGAPSAENLQLTRQIIERRVNALGVGEASVTTAGDRQIIVSVPNVQQDELVRTVGTTAQLAFRQVLAEAPVQVPSEPTASPTTASTTKPTAQASGTPSSQTSGALGTASAAPSASVSPTGNARPYPNLPTAPASPTPTHEPSATATAQASPTPSVKPTPRPTAQEGQLPPLEQRLKYQYTQQDADEFMKYKCGDPFPDVLGQPLITCDQSKQFKYLLGPVLIEGRNVSSATAGVPQGQLAWEVGLNFNSQGAKDFDFVTSQMFQMKEPTNQLAIVLDSTVISAPRINNRIPNGQASITGSFNQKSATELANVLKYGALPVALETSSVDNVSATLGADQLRAGIIAGLIGLGLVVAYAFLYYRGLGIVVVASLAVAGTLTYATLVLLGQSLDLALNLPGIAGAIVAIGVTADSFVIYFERIRDEVRDGRTLRTAIETGWKKARPTIVVADCVSLLSATVLFILAIGAVRGFAFTLGITTLIDLAIIFFFTKPLMTLLGRTTFYGEGHRWSGLEAEHMGVDHLNMGRTPTRKTRPAATKEA